MLRRVILILIFLWLCLMGMIFYLKFFSNNDFSVNFLNVGQGDATLIHFDNGIRMLIDCGPDRKILFKLGQYLPFYDRTIDYLLITHYDNDHYGGCVDVLRRYNVKNIIDNGATKPDDRYWAAWNKYRTNERADSIVIDRANSLIIASSTLNFFSPDKKLNLSSKETDSNNSSIVFLLSHHDSRFLFVGDAELPLENALVNQYCAVSSTCPALHADYLKIGHHGSDSSSGDMFLSAVSPSVAVISVGKNTFGHPSLRVLRRLERMGIDVWRTDQKDDIIVSN